MVKLTIDGRECRAEEEKTILEVASENGIHIPTLCYHEEVSPYGACRLCMVEVTRKGRKRLVASCLYPVAEGLVVRTETPEVNNIRRTVIELLLARCPDSEVVQEMAHDLGVDKPIFSLEEDNHKCILCALCTRVCQEVVGVSAITLVNRGVDRQMATPFYDFSEVCIGCGSCSFVCPTRAISFEDVGDTRVITMPHVTMEFKLKKCSKCGKYWAPERQLEYIAKTAGIAPEAFDICPDCRD
ncbi:MAG: 2Fe-2S iron-sulfur cluster-binding protein [Dehalococcoidales bacterium]|nr:2Fe-2S iron-sulfur cluster-binding protein [Dehalococcoidales bacterium]